MLLISSVVNTEWISPQKYNVGGTLVNSELILYSKHMVFKIIVTKFVIEMFYRIIVERLDKHVLIC